MSGSEALHYLGLVCVPVLRRRVCVLSRLTGVLKCSGLVRGNLSKVSLSIKCLSPFRQICVRLSVAMSPSSNTVTHQLTVIGIIYHQIQAVPI